MTITVHGLSKAFGKQVALDGVSFDVPEGDLVALLGPSGGGKSTILRIIAGLESADAGSVVINGEAVDALHARERRIGFVFQHYALFRHMNVAENIGFGLTVRGVAKGERDERVAELLEIMALTGLGPRMPSQLSGGQRQRVALARALAPAPSVLLLDEPFAAVDAKVRAELRRWLRRLHDDLHVTSLFVTHDQDEAFSVADRVVLVNRGRIEQVGTPNEVLENPGSEFVASFVGDVNVIDAVVRGGTARAGALVAPARDVADATRVRLVIRSYDMKFWRDDTNGIATVERVVPLGDRVRVEAMLPDVGPLFAHFPRRSSLLNGVSAGVRIAIEVTLARAYPASGISRGFQ